LKSKTTFKEKSNRELAPDLIPLLRLSWDVESKLQLSAKILSESRGMSDRSCLSKTTSCFLQFCFDFQTPNVPGTQSY